MAANLLLVVFGLVVAGLLIEGALRLFPNLASARLARAVDIGTVRYTTGMGDIFLARPGKVAPPDNPTEVLSEHRLAWDADGFRVPARPAEHYEILALGDSYTEGANVGMPWPDALAEASGKSVRNLGFRGYGPVEEAKTVQEFGAKSGAKLMVVAFFEGNDLSDIDTARWRDLSLLPSVLRKTFAPFDPNAQPWKTDSKGPFQYPVSVTINGTPHSMAFLDGYISWLNGTRDAFDKSANLVALGKDWDDMQKVANATGACVVVAYFPSAPHIYVPFVVPQDRDKVLSTLTQLGLEHDGEWLVMRPTPPTFDDLVSRLDNQRDSLADLAKRQHMPFIDLVPVFKDAANKGQILYYTYDTHPNQAGQTLAGQTIASYLAQHPNPCASGS